VLPSGNFCRFLSGVKVTLKPFSDPTKPAAKWVVYYPSPDGGRKRRATFPTKKQAEVFAGHKKEDLEAHGRKVAGISNALKAEVLRCVEKLPEGRTLTEAVDHFLAHIQATEKSAPISDLEESFLESMTLSGKSKRYLEDLRHRLYPFVEEFGTRYAAEISTKMAEEWLNGRDGSNLTRNHFRRVLSAFFAYCERGGYVIQNPITRIPKAKASSSKTEVFTPEEMQALLNLAEGDLRAYIAIGGFAGLRDSEIQRLDWSSIRWDSMKIDLSAATTKTAQRRLVEILPALEAWLEPYRFLKSGPVCERGFPTRLRRWKEQLPFKWKQNGLRHSFASYHLAHWKDAGRVSLELGHNNSAIVFAHYREIVSEKNSEFWWNQIRPTEALTYAFLNAQGDKKR
jgi:integrase